MTSDARSDRAGAGGGPQLLRVTEAFRVARGEESDARWAETALVSLVFADVDIDLAETLVGELAEQVAASGRAAEELFGEPREWARDLVAELTATGVDAFSDPLRLGVRDVVVFALGAATGLAVLLLVVTVGGRLLGGDPVQVGAPHIVAPLLLGTLVIALIAAYGNLRGRWRFPVLATVLAAGVVGGSTAAALVFQAVQRFSWEGSWPWSLVIILGYASATATVATLWRPPTKAPLTSDDVDSRVDDATWLQRLRTAGRSRGDLTDARIDDAVAVARTHGVDTGANLVDEFGSPEGYARSLPSDPVVIPRRRALVYAVAALGWLSLGLGQVLSRGGAQPADLTYAALVLLCGLSAWQDVRRARSARRAAR